MKPTLLPAIVHAIQVFAAVVVATGLKPWAKATFASVPEPILVLLLALVGAILVEIAALVFLGRPRIDLVWWEEATPKQLTSVEMTLSPTVPTSLAYTVEVNVAAYSILGRAVLRSISESQCVLSLRFPSAPMKAVVDRSPRVEGRPTVVDNDENGFDFDLHLATAAPKLWTWTVVRFEAFEFPPLLDVDVVRKLVVASPKRAQIAGKLIIVSSDVSHLRFRSS